MVIDGDKNFEVVAPMRDPRWENVFASSRWEYDIDENRFEYIIRFEIVFNERLYTTRHIIDSYDAVTEYREFPLDFDLLPYLWSEMVYRMDRQLDDWTEDY